MRTLTLKREALTDLTPAELTGVRGGAAATGFSCPFVLCISNDFTCLECITRRDCE